jgi:4-hydroxybenzoate polyprenyltransferase
MFNAIRKKITILRLLRSQQWIKNTVVFSPLIIAQNVQINDAFRKGIVGFVIFSCAASLVYILNDVLDFKYDHVNSSKSDRPIAASKVSHFQIATVSSSLALLLVYLLWISENIITIPIAIYILGNVFYSTLAKKVLIFDLLLIAIFFLLRLNVGSQIMQIDLSYLHYLIGLFCFLGLASLKRYVEISNHPDGVPGRNYNSSHLKVVSLMGLLCAFTSTVLLVFYLRGNEILNVYRFPLRLLAIVPIFIGEVLLLVHKARRHKLSEDLTMLWRNDTISQIFFIAVLLIFTFSR